MENKLMQKIFAIFMLAVVFIQNIIVVNATTVAPKPIIITYESVYTNLGTEGSSISIRKAKYTENGTTKYGYVYCLEGGAGSVYVNSSYSPDTTSKYADKETGAMNDDGIRYITVNGFWGSSNIGDGDPSESEKKDYAATQLAIWLYYYDISLDEEKYNMDIDERRISTLAREVRNNKYDSTNSTYVYIVEKANKLCEAAKKARLSQVACEKDNSCTLGEKAELNVNVNNKNLKLSSDGKFLESELITVSLKKVSSYTVNVSDNNFVVVDENGNAKTTFKDGDKIKIRASLDKVDSSVNVSLSFKASSSERVPYQYYGGTYTYNGTTLAKQRLLFGAVFSSVKLEKTLNFTYELGKTKVEFSKIDVTTGKELPGAHLEIRGSEGNLIEAWVSTNETHFFELLPGKYTLTETIAPEGYELSTESIEFEVKENGSTTKVVMENKPVKKEIKVEFSKIDVTNGKELPGAHLEIRDSKGNLIYAWISTNETHFFELLPGKYTLTEIISPEGYELATESIEFEVKEDGTLTKVVMENAPKKIIIDVEFSKIDVSTGKELPGAHLELKDVNGNLIDSWVSTNETHYVKLAPGVYTLTETIAPEGYELSTESIEFEVKADGSVTKIIMENKPYIEVPITSLNASSTAMILGSLLFSFGLIMVYGYVKKERVQ